VEGNNVNSDCWALEHVPDSLFRQPSGDAADFYHRWHEDVAMAGALGLQALRFSLEWSRIEPAPGEFSNAQLDHYRRIAAACRDAHLTTVVTFNHWTTPIWFAADGGWENPASVERFTRFADVAARHLAGEVDWALTLNEPNVATVAATGGAVAGTRGNRERALEQAGRLHPGGSIGFRPMMLWDGDHLGRYVDAHRRAREAIKSHMAVPVGWSLACEDYQARPGCDEAMARLRQRALTDWLEASRQDDFVGVQNYTRRLVEADGVEPVPDGAAVNDLGWELYPPSLTNAVRYAAEVTRRPVVVTEHGVATRNDTVRLQHTRESLKLLACAIEDGVDVRGYLHWTLVDEFEWFAGYDTTFGLVQVHAPDSRRTPRPSARWLGGLARSATGHPPPTPARSAVSEAVTPG
jgi:beta-glucosidase